MKKNFVTKCMAGTLACAIPLSGITMPVEAANVKVDFSVDAGKYEVLRDANGQVYDLGGMEIIVRDWWSPDEPFSPTNQYEKDTYEYQNWLQDTYNFTIKRVAIGDWGTNPSDFVDYATSGGDDKNYIFCLRDSEETKEAIIDGLTYDFSSLNIPGINERIEKDGVNKLYRIGNATYALTDMPHDARTGLFFNKKILREAGIDPDAIYDMQANGTWTWDAFTNVLDQISANTEYEGVCANTSTFPNAAVYSNDSQYVSYDATTGTYINGLYDEKTITALNWVQSVLENYWINIPEDAYWDYYKEVFRNGGAAFLAEDAYVGQEGTAEYYLCNEGTDFGFVVFPKGPSADNYTNCWFDNLYVIPACYDYDRAWKIAFAYDLYSKTTPGYTQKDVLNTLYGSTFDERALNETLSIMSENGRIDYKSMVIESDTFNGGYSWCIWPGMSMDDLNQVIDNARSLFDEDIENFEKRVDNVAFNSTIGKYAAVFDADYYASHNSDVVASGATTKSALFAHFLNAGMSEGRRGNEAFSFDIYKQYNEDLAALFGDNRVLYYEHYINHGKAENRTCNERNIPKPSYEVLRDENGNVYDLGGIEITVRNWWSDPEGNRSEAGSQYEEDRYEYIDWLQDTYNFTIKEQGIGDWSSVVNDYHSYVGRGGDDKNYIFTLRHSFETTHALLYGLAYDVASLNIPGINEKIENNGEFDLYKIGNSVYAMFDEVSAPRTGIYFNKEILKKAGIDPESIYDMQANGTWTWSAFEDLLDRVNKETSYDAVCGNVSAFPELVVLSNNAKMVDVDKETGLYVDGLNNENTVEALNWVQTVLEDYWMEPQPNDNWNSYEERFSSGSAAFMIGDFYMGSTIYNYMPENTEVGFVMFPKGPAASDYVNPVSSNPYMIPSCYDYDRAWKIAFAFDLYQKAAPGYDYKSHLIENYRNNYVFDERTFDETISMMLDKRAIDYKTLDFISYQDFSYNVFVNMTSSEMSEAIENAKSKFDPQVDSINRKVKDIIIKNTVGKYSAVFDADYYAANNPDVVNQYGTDAIALFKHFLNAGMSEGRRGNEAFDYKIYKLYNTDVAAALGDDKAAYYEHYINFGMTEGRPANESDVEGKPVPTPEPTPAPGPSVEMYAPVFNAEYYAQANPDVASAFNNDANQLFEHFVNFGMKEGRRASEDFDVNAYKKYNGDLAAAFTTNEEFYMHYINFGKSEGRTAVEKTTPDVDPSKPTMEQFALVFNAEYYAKENPDVASAFNNDANQMFDHFINFGMKEGRRASENFDVNAYKKYNGDLTAVFSTNEEFVMHYINFGHNEPRTTVEASTPNKPSMEKYADVFDAEYYAKANSDVAAAFNNDANQMFDHFINFGMKEGRRACEAFDVKFYRENNADLQAAFQDDLVKYFEHYMNYGKKEDRKFAPKNN